MPPAIKQVDELIDYFDKHFEVFRDISIAPQYTLIARPNSEIADEIYQIIQVLQEKDPRHLYCKKEMLHLTLYGNISPGLDVEKFYSFIKEITSQLEMPFHVHGVTQLSAMVMAEPDFPLQGYRKKIIDYLQTDEVPQYLSWFNLFRAQDKPNAAFIEYLKDQRSKDFGFFQPETVELYLIKSKMMDETWKKVFSVPLKSRKQI